MSYLVVVIMMFFLVVCFLASRIMDKGIGAVFTKTIASLGMILGALLVLKEYFTFYFIYIFVGLVCGLIGDIYLELKRIYPQDNDTYFNIGVAAFSLGHIMYLLAILNIFGYAFDYLWPVLISLLIAIAFACVLFFVLAKPMKLDFKTSKWQSFAYCILLVFMASFSTILTIKTGTNLFFTLGLIVFLLSDLVLSMQYFYQTKDGSSLVDNNILTIVNHVLYYGAQTLIIGVLYGVTL